MIVKIDFDEELIGPLLQEHVITGRAVQSLIQEAISFYNKCREGMKDGKQIAIGKESRGYFNNFEIILAQRDEL